MNAAELAVHVDNVWESMNEGRYVDRDERARFPKWVCSLMKKHGVDYREFVQEWNELLCNCTQR